MPGPDPTRIGRDGERGVFGDVVAISAHGPSAPDPAVVETQSRGQAHVHLLWPGTCPRAVGSACRFAWPVRDDALRSHAVWADAHGTASRLPQLQWAVQRRVFRTLFVLPRRRQDTQPWSAQVSVVTSFDGLPN